MRHVPLSAVVVTFNNRSDISACLESLRRSTRPPDEILVVDNASVDGTPDVVRRDFPDVTVLDFWDNPGFGEAHNRAFRVANGEQYLLLNPDAEIAPDAIERLQHAMETAPGLGLGVAVPKVRLRREPRILNSVGLRMNGIGYAWDRGYLEWDAGQYDEGGAVLAGSGCALLLSAAMVRAVGGFDPAYFLYYEDLDLCLRSWRAGFPVRYVPEAVALHRMKVSGRPEVYNDYLDHRNRLRVMLKTFPPLLLAGALARSARFDAASIWGAMRRGDRPRATRRLQSWLWNLAHLPDTLRRRLETRRGRGGDAWTTLLTEGSSWPTLKAALPSYAERYEETVDSVILHDTLTMGNGDAGQLGLGWYGLEQENSVHYRWSCGYAIAFLQAPAAAATLHVECRPLREMRLRVQVDGQPQGEILLHPNGWKEYSLPIRCDRVRARIELFPDPVMVPAEMSPGSPDVRTLGLSVSALRLTAVGTAPHP
jgi:GT2 family glycosyltransferase